ncbi:putative iq calmodulin-binding motif protein [Golovinomyces cichoracearum]|uniref:Putative iq calmodulin-binding motif protein n=1 Tax=Golovinomyces cichoracearum TaxID=62708 RepID=A0A420IZK2_9PEZI|nr:putative iq calmodulin-binding motif protein [Golovinomyces cichoracearum]
MITKSPYQSFRLMPLINESPRRSKSQITLEIPTRLHCRICNSNDRHEYLNSLQVPNPEQMRQISAIQEYKELENLKKQLHGKLYVNLNFLEPYSIDTLDDGFNSEDQRVHMLSMSPSSRLVEVVREAMYRYLTGTCVCEKKISILGGKNSQDKVQLGNDVYGNSSSRARRNWKKVGLIARRAGRDEDVSLETTFKDSYNVFEKKHTQIRCTRQDTKEELRRRAKLMPLQYFLEMVDSKHRYGPNLRIYHEEWKKSETSENFFSWLDYGQGSNISCQACPRERLERERVRYLNKEERGNYLVTIDQKGHLCWAKNGIAIDTSKKYGDSTNGIVLVSNLLPKTQESAPNLPIAKENLAYKKKDSSMNSTSLYSSIEKLTRKYKKETQCSSATAYAKSKLNQKSPNVKIIRRISFATILDRLLRESVKSETWIFVADTKFRLYVGIKQSGTFQHSSFLHGSRVSAAGSIEVKDGKLVRLSPLSGHYRPPVANFRVFIHALKEAGVDTSEVSISRSYAVLVALETYLKSRRVTKQFFDDMILERGKSVAHQVFQRKEKKKQNNT